MPHLYSAVTALVCTLLLLGLPSSQAEPASHLHDFRAHLDEAMELLTKAKDSYANLQDYVAEIHKEVHIHGKLDKDEHTIIKFQKPFKLYLKWLSGKNDGAELLYVEGQNDGKLIVHKKVVFGIKKTMELAPDGFWVRNFSKHSIKDAGFGGIIAMSHNQLAEALKNNDVMAISCSEEEVNGRPTHKIAFAVSPQGKHNGYYCRSAVEYFDAEHFLPVKATFWLWEDDEVESFTFNDVKLNVGLSDKDFDRENEAYHF